MQNLSLQCIFAVGDLIQRFRILGINFFPDPSICREAVTDSDFGEFHRACGIRGCHINSLIHVLVPCWLVEIIH